MPNRVVGVRGGGRRGVVRVAVHVDKVREVGEAVVGGVGRRQVVGRRVAPSAAAAVAVLVRGRGGGGDGEAVVLVDGRVGVARGGGGGRRGRRVVAVVAGRRRRRRRA